MICKNVPKSRPIEVSEFCLDESPINHNIREIRNCKNETETIASELYGIIQELQNDKQNLYREILAERKKNKQLQRTIYENELQSRRKEEQLQKIERKYEISEARNKMLEEDIEYIVKERIECEKKYRHQIFQLQGKIETELPSKLYEKGDESTII